MASEPRQRPDEDLVRLYLNQVGRYALLTKDDEARLARAIEAGRAARDRLGVCGDHDALSTTKERELRHQAQVEAYSLEDVFLQLTGGTEDRATMGPASPPGTPTGGMGGMGGMG